MAKKEKKQTPLMAQYNRIKSKYPDALLLFRVGDFYETFGQDAIKASVALGIVLTKRNNGAAGKIELAGFPHHALDTYLPKLVQAGYRVAICDQLEDPKATNNIVKRGVTEVITPGVALNDQLLDHKSNNFLASVFIQDKRAGVSFLDLSTGEFFVSEGDIQSVDKLLSSFQPKEIIHSIDQKQEIKQYFGEEYYTYALEPWILEYEFAYDHLTKQFNTTSLKGFGIEEMHLGICAAGACLQYMSETQHPNLGHITHISRIQEHDYVWIDRFTIRNLELIAPQHSGGVTLLDVIDHTVSPMGSRLLKRWTVLPLINKQQIEARLQAVDFLVANPELLDNLQYELKQIGDLERLISKLAALKANPRDINQLKQALEHIQPIQQILQESNSESISSYADLLMPLQSAKELIHNTIEEEVPVAIQKGNVIKSGVNIQLDEYRDISKHGKQKLANIQQAEQEKTGISSLKIGFNNVFGYYLEVTNKYKNQVPEQWIRKQTLTNSERYITEELKVLEEKILSAEDKKLALEVQLFESLITELQQYIEALQQNAKCLAQIDCLCSFASLSMKQNYCKPEITDQYTLDIKEGRHPVIEQQLPLGEQFIPNDVYLSNDDQQIMIITGPNMSGKSAILRQTALIVLLAQMGCFVPASSATIGIIDKLFTRVGASDNLSVGESTFMVEMLETSSIMNNISPKSLILLDEIGRGTSTYDGISIAWSIAEYLHENKVANPKTLFATHYHELNELSESLPRIKNYHVATKEVGQEIIFLRTLTPGGSQHSFGIHVAKLAGMPKWIVNRAQVLLQELEQKQMVDFQEKKKLLKTASKINQYQLSIFDMGDSKQKEVLEAIEDLDVNIITPVEAMLKLNEMKQKLK